MKNAKKISIWIAVGFIVLGVGVSLAAFLSMDRDPAKLSSTSIGKNTYPVEASFDSIQIDTESADVEFVLSEKGKSYVVCEEYENRKHTVNVKDDTLSIRMADKSEWYENVGVYIGDTKITVCLAEADYEKLDLTLVSGDLSISAPFSFNDVKINNTSGDIDFGADVKHELTAESVSGEIDLKGIKSEKINCETVSGDIELTNCDAGVLKLTTISGDVEGILCSDKIFTVDTVSGEKEVPKTATGGSCEITTVSGDIEIYIKP